MHLTQRNSIPNIEFIDSNEKTESLNLQNYGQYRAFIQLEREMKSNVISHLEGVVGAYCARLDSWRAGAEEYWVYLAEWRSLNGLDFGQ